MIYLYLRRVRCLPFITVHCTAAADRAQPPAQSKVPRHAHSCASAHAPAPPSPRPLKTRPRYQSVETGSSPTGSRGTWPPVHPQCPGTAGKGLPLTGLDPDRQCSPGAPPPALLWGLRPLRHWAESATPPTGPSLPPCPQDVQTACVNHIPHNAASQ